MSDATILQRPDLLETIVASSRRIVDIRAEREPVEALERRARQVPTRDGVFRQSLVREGTINLIAECKRRSPSRGLLRARYDQVELAVAYEQAGAVAISVLTEPTFFDGSLEDLANVRNAVDLPVLRKDFIIDRYQVLEARVVRADAVLLIVAALNGPRLSQLLESVRECGLEALVEVHDAEELGRALDAGAAIVGVNSRNLRTLEVRQDVCVELISKIPDGVVAVAESGLRSGPDVARLRQAGFRAFLIGEHFVTSETPGAAVRRMLDEAQGCFS